MNDRALSVGVKHWELVAHHLESEQAPVACQT
jgi:hypothetical protein